jgi:hypothetical protein
LVQRIGRITSHALLGSLHHLHAHPTEKPAGRIPLPAAAAEALAFDLSVKSD